MWPKHMDDPHCICGIHALGGILQISKCQPFIGQNTSNSRFIDAKFFPPSFDFAFCRECHPKPSLINGIRAVAICRIYDLPIGASRIHEGCSTDKADCRGEIARMYNQLAEEIAGQTLRNLRMEAVKDLGILE